MSLSEATELYKECTKYGSPYDPRIPYSGEDCTRLFDRMNQLSLEEAGKYKGSGVGQPMLH